MIILLEVNKLIKINKHKIKSTFNNKKQTWEK